MGTYDQMIVDNRYSGDFDNENYLFSKESDAQEDSSNKDDDANGLLGRRVYLESPSFGNKEEEDMYRYVSSRLTNHTGSLIDTKVPAPTGATLMDSLDYELDVMGTNNTRSQIPHRRESNPVKSQGQLSTTLTTMPRADPRQDPLLGPLLAELDAMSNQQQQQQIPPIPFTPPRRPSTHRRNSLPYQSSFVRPTGSSQTNHVLSNIANRAVTDALFEVELLDTLDSKDQPQQQQQQQQQQQRQHQMDPYSTSNINLSNYSQFQPQIPSRFAQIDNSDIFVPSSYSSEPNSFLNYFGPEDQLFQRPTFNSLGQNYIPNTRQQQPPPPPPQFNQRVPSLDQTHIHLSPTQRTSYARPQLTPNAINSQQQQQQTSVYSVPSNQQNRNVFDEYQKFPPQQQYNELNTRQINPPNNQEMFFTDAKDDQFEQQSPVISQRSNDQLDQDSKRQAVWSELQRTSAKTQEKKSKKREAMNRSKGTFGSSSTWNSAGSQPLATQFKPPQRIVHHPPPITKPSQSEEYIDTNRNKENVYRPPARRYEKLNLPIDNENERYEHEPKIVSLSSSPSTKPPRQSSLPVTFNLNTNEKSHSESTSGVMTVPLDSHITRDGDKISLNIDLRLVDIQNIRQQQQQQQQQAPDPGHWSNFDPLERHIRKLERNIDQSLPTTNPPQRSPTMPSTGVNASMGRYGKAPTGTNRSGYNPPIYGGDYNYNDTSRDEDSYLSKLNQTKKFSQFKPYTGRDYDQFKKNYGFGSGHLGSDFDNTTHKEKMEKLAKTRQYAQQIEARNKKKLSDGSRRTYSDTRLPAEASKSSRLSVFPYTSVRAKQYSGKSAHSSPPSINGILPYIPARRPTEVLYRPVLPVPRQLMISPQHEDNETIVTLSTHHEDEYTPRQPTMSPLQKRHEQRVQSDSRHIGNVTKLDQSRANQRYYSSLPKHVPIARSNNNDIKRRPIRFDKLLLHDESTNSSAQQNGPIQERQQHKLLPNIDQSINQQQNTTKMITEAARQELNEPSVNDKEQ
ncbi:unnamed protein product [Rotaria socialis]